MISFNDWCKELGVATLCDYNDSKIKSWIEKRENWDSVMWINYQKAYSKSNGRILGLETERVNEGNR
jgi:hypothetical protein